MPLNPNISLAYKGIELQNPLDQYGKVMALQSAQQQNALAQRQMQEYDRSLQESEGVRNRLAGGAKIDEPETYNFLLGSKTGREILKQDVDLQKARTEEAARRTKLMVDAEAMWRNIVDQVRTKEDAVLFLDKMRNDPAMKGSPLTTLPFEGIVAQLPSDSAGLNEWAKKFAIGATKWVTENKPTLSTKDTNGELIDRTYEPLTGKITEVSRTAKVMTPAETAAAERDRQRLQFERQRVELEGRRVAAMEKNARRGTVQGSTPAQKPMTPVQEAARRDKLGKEFKAAQNALQTTQDVLDSIAFVKSEPGLDKATGFTGTLLPSFPEGEAASAEVRLKNLEGKITALGKAQASASGAIGAIANQEWKMLADQIAAIDRLKGTGPLLAQLELVEAQAQGAMERIRDAYQRQFGEDFQRFPQFADLPAPKTSFKPRSSTGSKPASGGGLSAAEQAELDELRKRFGR